MTGKAGPVRFIGGPTLRKMGVAISRMTVSFSGDENGDVDYTAGVGVRNGVVMSVHGTFNTFDLIKSCSGLLCQAARLLDMPNPAVDIELQRHMGY